MILLCILKFGLQFQKKYIEKKINLFKVLPSVYISSKNQGKSQFLRCATSWHSFKLRQFLGSLFHIESVKST